MALALPGGGLARALSHRSISTRLLSHRNSLAVGSISRRKWASASIREVWSSHSDVFQESGREDDGEELKWAAIERLPTYDLLKRGMLKQVLDNGRVEYEEIDLTNLGVQDKQHLMERILQVVKEDNERLLYRLGERTDR